MLKAKHFAGGAKSKSIMGQVGRRRAICMRQHEDHQKYINVMKKQGRMPSTHSTVDTHTVNPNDSAVSTSSAKQAVHIIDRVSHLQAYILSIICENNLPLSMAPKLIGFGKIANQDQRVFKKLVGDKVKDSFSHTTVTYKIVHGLGKAYHSRIVAALITTPFSLNIDECASKTCINVFSIIVMYVDRTLGKSVFQNYNSISLIKADAKTITTKITDMFTEDGIPMKNLIADLSDSANTMRGRHNGVEKRLRDLAPHMLYIGGDTCHDMHRSCKSFAENFANHCEKFISDVHN